MTTTGAEVLLIASGPVARWVVFGVATAALVVVVMHVEAVRRSDMPASRKRIRTVNGWLMLFAVPLIAAGFVVARPQSPRLFVLVWLVALGLVGLILMLACLDMLNTYRIARAQHRELVDQLNQVRRGLAEPPGGGPQDAESPVPDVRADARPTSEPGQQ
jgi:hypothetical protein